MAARVQRQNVPDYRVYQAAPGRPAHSHHHAGLQFQPAAPSISSNHHHHRHNHHHNHHNHAHHAHHTPSAQNNSRHSHYNPRQNVQPIRTLSNATSSSNSTGNNNYLTHTMSSASSDIHRSSSGRSAPVQLSYVALMRRQKGTVWCDRAQPEDPRLQAQKRAARQRAHNELHGGSRSGPLASGKIRHQSGKTGPIAPSTLVGATVPVRLSANEVGDDYADDHSSENYNNNNRRASGSARSSLGSMQRYPSGYQRQPGKTPPNEQADIPEVVESAPVENNGSFDSSRNSSLQKDTEFEHSTENDFGDIGEMAAPAAAQTAMQKAKTADDLRRRGSVDERTTSLTGQRLFVANPDQDD